MNRSHAAVRHMVVAAVIAFIAAACGGSTSDVNLARYSLVSVDGEPLPGPYPDPSLPTGMFQVTQGELTLNPNGAFLMDLFIRCHPQQPPSECSVTGNGRQPMVGTYSVEQGFIQFGSRQYAATFSTNRVEIHILIPPSEGQWPSFVLEFAR